MRIIHMTDVHFLRTPGLRRMMSKRALGLVNLYVVGRRNYFDAATLVRQAVADALQWKADLFVMTGDVTAMSMDEEFEEALHLGAMSTKHASFMKAFSNPMTLSGPNSV